MSVHTRRIWSALSLGLYVSMFFAGDARAFTAYVSNEKSNTISVIDTSRWEVVRTIKVGQRLGWLV